jgi:hypothetical protein
MHAVEERYPRNCGRRDWRLWGDWVTVAAGFAMGIVSYWYVWMGMRNVMVFHCQLRRMVVAVFTADKYTYEQ